MASGDTEAVGLPALKGLRRRDLFRFLESDERVREWLGSGVLLSTKEAAEFLEVDRPRIWRWQKAGRIKAVAQVGATPLFLRSDLERAKLREAGRRNGAHAD